MVIMVTTLYAARNLWFNFLTLELVEMHRFEQITGYHSRKYALSIVGALD
jgi:hypothetical protein